MDLKTCYSCGKIIAQDEKCSCKTEEERKRKRDYQRIYDEENPELTRVIKTARYKRFRKEIIKRDGGYCQRCKNLLGMINTKNLEVHHIKPRVHYPELVYEKSNVITVCKQCNMALGLSGKLDFEPDIDLDEGIEYFIL